MDVDVTSSPEAFARANEEARRRHLRSLTLERAAAELEDLLNLAPEFERSSEALGLRPLPPPPLPGPSLAVLLAGEPFPDREQ